MAAETITAPDDVAKVGTALFQVNVLVSAVVMAAVVLDAWIG